MGSSFASSCILLMDLAHCITTAFTLWHLQWRWRNQKQTKSEWLPETLTTHQWRNEHIKLNTKTQQADLHIPHGGMQCMQPASSETTSKQRHFRLYISSWQNSWDLPESCLLQQCLHSWVGCLPEIDWFSRFAAKAPGLSWAALLWQGCQQQPVQHKKQNKSASDSFIVAV